MLNVYIFIHEIHIYIILNNLTTYLDLSIINTQPKSKYQNTFVYNYAFWISMIKEKITKQSYIVVLKEVIYWVS